MADILRSLISATITNTQYLKALTILWRENLAPSKWRWVASRCFEYFTQYGEAPGKNIETIWESCEVSPEIKNDLEGLLSSLSEEWEKESDSVTTEFLIKETEKYFSRELFLQLSVEIEAAAEAGNLEKVEELVSQLRPPKIPALTVCSPSSSPEKLKKAFSQSQESLVDLGGAYQELVGIQIIPDSFVVLMGGEKVGKTWMLQSIAFSGVKKKKNVYFAQCGDLSENQQLLRLSIQLSGRSNRTRYCSSSLIPVMDCQSNQNDTCDKSIRESVGGVILDPKGVPYPKFYNFNDVEKDYRACTGCPQVKLTSWWERAPEVDPLTWEESTASWNKFQRVTGDRLKIDWFPNGSATIREIDRRLHQMYDTWGWKPDIIIADYLDIFDKEPDGIRGEFRHQIDHQWKAARRLSQTWKCSFVSATQATREGASRRVLKPTDTSEDKRKAAHVTAMFGLNKDDHDKERKWMRVNPLYLREDEYSTIDQVTVLQFLQRGCPNLGSFWFKKGGQF